MTPVYNNITPEYNRYVTPVYNRTTTYKMVGHCSDGGQRLERKSRGQSKLEESCGGSQSPPRAVICYC